MYSNIIRTPNIINPHITVNLIKKEVTHIQSRDNDYIKYSLLGNEKTPNVIIGNTNFISHNLYIWKGKIHDIPNIDYDAECIIETMPSGSNGKCFVCFLLKTAVNMATDKTSIDLLWNNTEATHPIQLDLEKDMARPTATTTTTTTAMYFKNGIDTIIIILDVINVKSNLKANQSSKCFLMPSFIPNYIITPIHYGNGNRPPRTIQDTTAIEGFTQTTPQNFDIVGLDGNNDIYDVADVNNTGINLTKLTESGLYLDCAPTSQSTNTLSAITIPLDKAGNVNLSNSLAFSSIINALIVLLIVVTTFLSTPTLYKYTIMNIVRNSNIADKQSRLTTVGYFMFFIFIVFSAALIIDGIRFNIYEFYAGLVSAAFLGISTIRLFSLRHHKDFNFPLIYNWSPNDISVWLKESYYFFLDYHYGIGSVFFTLLVIVFLAFMVPILVTPASFLTSNDTTIHAIIVVAGFGVAYSCVFAPFLYLMYKTISNSKGQPLPAVSTANT